MLDKDDGLRRRDLKAFPAPHILACEHIVDANHVVAGLLKLGTLVFVDVAWGILFLGPLHPANLIIIPLAAMRAGKTRRLRLLLLVTNISFVHWLNNTTPDSGG